MGTQWWGRRIELTKAFITMTDKALKEGEALHKRLDELSS
jgi:hypothetical protein